MIMEKTGLGDFGNKRRNKVGEELLEKIVQQRTVTLRKLGKGRGREISYNRFLHNESVSVEKMLRHAAERTAEIAQGRHVLVIHDTTEINFNRHIKRKMGFGTVGNGEDIGLFLHPLLAVEAGTGGVLGVAGAFIHNRGAAPVADASPYEPLESQRWLTAAQRCGVLLKEAAGITMVADRESDTYEDFSLRPSNVHILARAAQDRKVKEGGLLFEKARQFPRAHAYVVDVPPKGPHKARTARVALSFGPVTLCRPARLAKSACPETVTLRAVLVEEIRAPAQAEPVCWLLLTSHEVTTVDDALLMVNWYKQRWIIEELNRTLKAQGLDLESSQIVEAKIMAKMVTVALIAAARIVQLVRARSGATGQDFTDGFAEEDLELLIKLSKDNEGKTEKQKNAHPVRSLAWAAWIIGRLGGWNCYYKPPGPKTFHDGLKAFDQIKNGWLLAKRQV